MKILKKINLVVFILFMGFGLSSCTLFQNEDSDGNKLPPIISNTAQIITLTQSEIEHIPSTVEEAVEETVEEPAEEVAEEATEESAEEPAEATEE